MGRHLFTVEDRFVIRQRGMIITPGVVPQAEELFRVGDPLELRRPDGTSLRVTLAGFTFAIPGPKNEVYFILPAEVTKSEVPVGSEVWSV